ncbi:hypothetical protein [Gordonia sputi]|uniref:hypothetical protein n=1 Tax=Gordonia sputi TaxID=36823 RepID=UPI00226F8483|nr:hypothetical protein [Gordonia sputi]
MSSELLNSPVTWIILGCEVGFWAVLISGLSVRYLLRRPRASSLVLLLVPLVDLILLIAVAVDLAHGSEVTTVHRIAGVYLGVTVAFGHSVIRWADARFAHRFAGGPAPAKRPRRGPVALRNEVADFGRWLVAAAVAAGAAMLLSVTVANPDQANALRGIFPQLGVITVIWLLTGPVWAMFSASDD